MSTTANRYEGKSIYDVVDELVTNMKGNGTFVTVVNVTVPRTAWTSDATYPNYPVRADIEIDGIDATFSPDVRLGYQLEQDGIISFATILSDGVVSIYGTTGYEGDIIIPCIICQKVTVK